MGSAKPKSHKLPHSTKVRIAKDKERYPAMTANELAQRYNCTPAQVYRAIKQVESGAIPKRAAKGSKDRLGHAMTMDAPDLIREQYRLCLAQLESDQDLRYTERIPLLDRLVAMRKTMQQVELEGHLKRIDAGIVAALVRLLMPEATDEQVITLYRQAEAIWKAQA